MTLGSEMMCLSDLAESVAEARKKLKEVIRSGAALDKLRQLVDEQGGDATMVDNIEKFEKPTESYELLSVESGYLSRLDARTVGEASMILGTGRETLDSEIDMTAGIYLNKKCGDYVNEGEVLAKLENRDPEKLIKASEILQSAYSFSDSEVEIPELIKGRVG